MIQPGARGLSEKIMDADLDELVDRLIEQQMVGWPELSEGISAWREVEVRKVRIEGMDVFLQHNPKRIVSTSAQVDEVSIQNRACFLCPSNMPPGEKGLAFGKRFVIVCNPFPVLAKHLVVVSREHVPQRLSGNLTELLSLAQSLGPGFVVIYNGPASGASAPDHLHFQAGVADELPILTLLKQIGTREPETEVLGTRAYGVRFLSVRGLSCERLALRVEEVMRVLGEMHGRSDVEPMVNLLARFTGRGWQVIVIPRERHRPAAYFAEGDDRLIVSPAAIDLGGLMVVPRERDFTRLDASLVKAIYAEVTFSDERLDAVLGSLARGKGGRLS
ncbi:MAG: DUF4922 domain-containing protein [Acidobacteriota bacterium]